MESAPPRADIPVLAALPLVIACSKFTLRPVTVADTEDLWPHVSNPELSVYMSWAPHASREVTSAFLQLQVDGLAKGTIVNWAIVLDGKACGLVTLAGITWHFSTGWRVDRAELGYWIGQPYWGQGLMTEAALTATSFAFDTLGLHKVTVGHMDQNEPSKRIIDAVICLGCLIKGDTMHFEYIADSVTHAVARVAVQSGVPVAFGVLTTLTEEQAVVRSRADGQNKGAEAARAAIEMASLFRSLDERPPA